MPSRRDDAAGDEEHQAQSPTITSLPKRAISAPVKKLGPNIASTCHWMPSAALSVPRPQATMASGAAVITRLISA